MRLYTTLRRLKEEKACVEGYARLRRSLPDLWGDDDQIDFLHILESNGLEDALWALKAGIPEQSADRNRIARLLAADFAEHALSGYEEFAPGDGRPRKAVEAARAFAAGKIDLAGMESAGAAAGDTALSASWSRPWPAVQAAVWAVFGDAPTAVRNVASHAVLAAARVSTKDAERAWQAEAFRSYLE
jgi:hypothetical protein